MEKSIQKSMWITEMIFSRGSDLTTPNVCPWVGGSVR